MMNKNLNERKYIKYSEHNWFAPWYVMDSLEKSVGTRDMQGHKEMWIAAMYAICRSTEDDTEWWVQFDKRNPPDTRIMKKNEKTDSLEIIDVECFELSQYDTHESVMQSIQRKIIKNGAPRQYGKNTAVVGFVRRSLLIDSYYTEDVKNLNPGCGSLSLIVDEKEGMTMRACIQLFPVYQKIIFDFKTKGRKGKQNPLITTHRKGTLEIVKNGEMVDVEMFPSPKNSITVNGK